jgi:hypothetical protein
VSTGKKKTAKKSTEDTTITEVGRELLKFLHKRVEEMGINQASYRQARMELLRTLDGSVGARFNWGFEAVFTKEVHSLEDLGLIAVKYGSGAIMAGKGKANQIYNLALTDDGKDTARVIVERERRTQAETAKLKRREEEEEDEDTDRIERDDLDTRAVQALDPEPPPSLPSDRYSVTGE